jgi:hypothetical protein
MRIAGGTRHELHGPTRYHLLLVNVFSQAGQTRISKTPRSSANTGGPSGPGMNVCQQTPQRIDGASVRWGVRHQRADVISAFQNSEVPGMTVSRQYSSTGFLD